MKNPTLAQIRAQRLAEILLIMNYAETEGAREYHKAQASRVWKELKEVME